MSAWAPWRIADGTCLVLHHQLRHLAGRHELTVLTPDVPATARPGEPAAPDPVTVEHLGPAAPGAVDYARRRLWSLRHREPAHVPWVQRPALLQRLDDIVAEGVDLVYLFGWGTASLADRVAPTPTVHFAVDAWSRAARTGSCPRHSGSSKPTSSDGSNATSAATTGAAAPWWWSPTSTPGRSPPPVLASR